MRVKLLTNGGYMTTNGSAGEIVEAAALGSGSIEVTSEELRSVGASEAFGCAYPYYLDEYEVIPDDDC